MYTITVKRNAKINVGNYENTDVGVEITAEFELLDLGLADLSKIADAYIRNRVDEIELGTKKSKSKADRFGV